MIGIIITEENKEKNQLPNAVGSIMIRQDYPNIWWGVQNCVGGYASLTDIHSDDGWKDVVVAELGENQIHGDIFVDGNVFRIPAVDKTDAQIQSEKLSLSESVKEQRIKEISDSLILEAVYKKTDIETMLANTDLYPMFEAGIEALNATDAALIPDKMPYRCKDFNADNELVLWEAAQSHTTAAEWRPKDVPALFKRVALDGEIPVWVQPLGAFDAYQLGDKVHFPTITDAIYESTVNNNTWAPNVYGWQLV